MARNGNLFALTSPIGEVGIFHQLGSTNRSRVCVQNCLVEMFGANKVFIGKRLKQINGYITFNNSCVGYFETPVGPYMVERITPADPRYANSPIIQEYSQFFGKKNVKAIINDVPAREAKKRAVETKNHTSAVQKMVNFLDTLIEELGYTKSQHNVVPLRSAAKRKK